MASFIEHRLLKRDFAPIFDVFVVDFVMLAGLSWNEIFRMFELRKTRVAII